VGSGAGFPGAVLSIYYGPLLNITLIESVSKKCAFLEFIKAELDLSYEVICKRAEHINLEFDYAVCRALGKLKDIEPIPFETIKKGCLCDERERVARGYQFCKIDLKDIKDSYIIFIPKTK
jgi:16S rRNA (guanine527-N7)-methyltransferase